MATPEPEVVSLAVAGSEVRLRWNPIAPEETGSAWDVVSEPDWGRLEGIRLISAAFEDGAALGVVAIRPQRAQGHGDDAVAARFLDAEGIRTTTSEALVSVEYDPAQRPRRVGIELWPEADSAPLRIAADREAEPSSDDDGAIVAMAFRLSGVAGRGTYEIVRPARARK
jgi:hypothetical protein